VKLQLESMSDLGGILMVIPARGGSKRLPRKNVLPLCGKPLICWTIEAALQTDLSARILVSSDDDEILALARRYSDRGVIAHRRTDASATDTATTAEALAEVVESERQTGYMPDTLILLQPTSPLRNAQDILAAVNMFKQAGCKDTVVSVCEVDHPSAWIGVIDEDSAFNGINVSNKRSQDYHKEYRLNGAVYVARSDVLIRKGSLFTGRLRASVMPRSRSVDVDEEADLRVCTSYLSKTLD
jgi:CMP-N,N'-diacetyllegionaminic acid synthase